jgi:hypothetical protein
VGAVGADVGRAASPGAARDPIGPILVAGRLSARVFFFVVGGASCRLRRLEVVADVPLVAAETTELPATTGLLA